MENTNYMLYCYMALSPIECVEVTKLKRLLLSGSSPYDALKNVAIYNEAHRQALIGIIRLSFDYSRK